MILYYTKSATKSVSQKKLLQKGKQNTGGIYGKRLYEPNGLFC